MIDPGATLKKFNYLKDILKEVKKCTVAFSGGVDSTFLTSVLKDIHNTDFLAIFISSPLIPKREEKEAIEWLKSNGINYIKLTYDPLSNFKFSENPPDRCYHCKKGIFTIIKDAAERNGFPTVIEGTNLDDIQDYRPGLMALKELQIMSPLKEAGLKKDEIRFLSREIYHLKNYSKPPTACLATRIPYFQKITSDKLAKVEKIEETIYNMGFNLYRARLHGDTIRIEMPVEDFNKIVKEHNLNRIIKVSKELGFKYITLDLEGYSTGKLIKNINKKSN